MSVGYRFAALKNMKYKTHTQGDSVGQKHILHTKILPSSSLSSKTCVSGMNEEFGVTGFPFAVGVSPGPGKTDSYVKHTQYL